MPGSLQGCPRGRSCGRLPPALLWARSWRKSRLASLAGVARRVASLFTQLEGTCGAKNNGEERLGVKGMGSRPVLARAPAVPGVVGVFLASGVFIACPAWRNLGNFTYRLPRRGLIFGASTGDALLSWPCLWSCPRKDWQLLVFASREVPHRKVFPGADVWIQRWSRAGWWPRLASLRTRLACVVGVVLGQPCPGELGHPASVVPSGEFRGLSWETLV